MVRSHQRIVHPLIHSAMSSLDSLLSTLPDEDNVVDTPEEGFVQCKKCETLKNAIHHGKSTLLTRERRGNGILVK